MAKTLPKEKESKEVAIIQKQISPLVANAEALEIKAPSDLILATNLLSKLNQFSDKMTEEKEKVTKPANEILKAERARWKPLETLYEGAISILRRKMTVFQTEADRVRREEEAKIAERTKAGKGNLSVETAVKKINALDEVKTTIEGSNGVVQFRSVKKFEVEDIMKIAALSEDARRFLLPNESEIRKEMLTGKPIPGVRYYEEKVPFNSR